jgi:hypothetical protein
MVTPKCGKYFLNELKNQIIRSKRRMGEWESGRAYSVRDRLNNRFVIIVCNVIKK